MVLLILLWLCMGALIGLLATAANLRPASWQPFGWLRMALLGATIAFSGGWLGILLLGRPFATPMALWTAVAGVVVVCIAWQRRSFAVEQSLEREERSASARNRGKFLGIATTETGSNSDFYP